MVNETSYDSKYSRKEFYWGLKPNNLVIGSLKYLVSNSKVLDLGSGEGRDSIFLAKKGFDVTAVDVFDIGIKKTEEFAKQHDLTIKTSVSNAASFLDNCSNFDAIYCLNVLQFSNEEEVKQTIEKIKLKTKPNGINVIASFIAEDKNKKELILSKGRYAFDKGELKQFYKDWKIFFYEEKLGDWETHGENPHRHFMVKLIAQKPWPQKTS
jgi:tellurite methyltransferase